MKGNNNKESKKKQNMARQQSNDSKDEGEGKKRRGNKARIWKANKMNGYFWSQ